MKTKLASMLFISATVAIFFWQFFIKGLLPIPADTIIGLYHPFRDLYANEYPNGIPFKNFLITDPVRQQYLWRELAISLEKKLRLPLWNPYNFSGTPLLANFQSAVFYPLNLLFLLMPFSLAWSFIIFLGPLLAGIFLFLYLSNIKLSKWASVLGAIVFSFSGFSIAWMEWGTITHVALWLPLILLAIDKIFLNLQPPNSKFKIQNSKLQLKIKNYVWPIIFIFSLVSAFFAGHLQIFFYLFIFSWAYFIARWFQFGKSKKILFLFIILNSLFIILTSIQWYPTLQFLQLSARNLDQADWSQNPGWFIPWQHLIQFIAPDFFGNPTTLNYWGVWNYGEFVGYIGIVPLILAIFAVSHRKDKKTLFFGAVFFTSLIFSLPTFLAKLPFIVDMPFLGTAQPTRLLFLTTFSLTILAALGFDYFVKTRTLKLLYPIISVGSLLAMLWVFVFVGNEIFNIIPLENLLVAKRNLYLPSILFAAGVILTSLLVRKTNVLFARIACIAIVGLVIFDLLRFGWKFTPFTKKDYLFPSAKAISYLQNQKGVFRIMATDSRILAPNFSVVYKLQSIEGYDPLYLKRYGELIAASQRKDHSITYPLGFNRIVAPRNYDSEIINLLGVKYVLSLEDIVFPKLKKVFQEGQTRIYENIKAMPRVFFVDSFKTTYSKEESMRALFEIDLEHMAVVEIDDSNASTYQNPILQKPMLPLIAESQILKYSEDKVIIKTESNRDALLVLTDSFYPTWKAEIDSKRTTVLRTDYNFRGVIVPAGKHIIEFYQTLL